jgi:outer membrane protein OmpA-like peptidoglycan-associated protein
MPRYGGMKTHLTFTIFFLSLFYNPILAQERIINLVPNPSFEELRNLPLKRTRRPMTKYEPTSGYIPFQSNLNYWFKGTQTTPDLRIMSHSLYAECSQFHGDCDKAKTGIKAVGLMTWLRNTYLDDYREYLQVKLRQPLEVGKKTYVSIWVCKERKAKLVSNNIGFFFSKKKIFKDTEGAFEITPHINCDSIINENRKQWVEITGEFIPEKPYAFVTIGNFFSNEKTDTVTFKNYTASKYNPAYAYYLIDDVKVWQDVDSLGTYVFNEEKIEEGKPFELPNILFEFNKAVLDTVSFAALNQLADFLKENASLQLSINGHTDSKGNAAYNLTLSEKRAKAVRDYLMKNGIPSERMRHKGFGEQQPISENDDENRRVEFLVKAQ